MSFLSNLMLNIMLEDPVLRTPNTQTSNTSLAWLRLRIALWFPAIREAYLALLPLTILGALALSLAEFPYPPFKDWLSLQLGPNWQAFTMSIYSATMGVMGFLGASAISFKVAGRLQAKNRIDQYSPLSTSALAGAAFLIIAFDGSPSLSAFGYANVFHSIWVAVLCAELMQLMPRMFPNSNNTADVEAGLPLRSAVELSLSAALSLALILSSFFLISQGLHALSQGDLIRQTLHAWLQLPAYVLNMLYIASTQLLWLGGINVVHIFHSWAGQPDTMIAQLGMNYAPGLATPAFVTAFAEMGGSGNTWGLILYCIFRSEDSALKRLAWVSVIPAILNVNELLLFGFPLVLSLRMVVPFLLAPLVSGTIASLFIYGLDMDLNGHSVSWTTPVLFSGYMMSNSWLGLAAQALGVLA